MGNTDDDLAIEGDGTGLGAGRSVSVVGGTA